jgi:hypothetical protein
MQTMTAGSNIAPGRGLKTSLILVRETLTGMEWDEAGGYTTKQCYKRKLQANRADWKISDFSGNPMAL